MTNNTTKRKKRCDHKKQSAWAREILPLARKARAEAYQNERASRVVPEISVKAWAKIEPYLKTVDRFDAYDLMQATGYCRGTVAKGKWLRAIVAQFPDEWEMVNVGGDAGGWRQVLVRQGVGEQ